MTLKQLIWLPLLFICLNAQAVSLKPKHPQQYTVQEGDTLWSIADEFLDKPWEWEKIWKHNPHIKNPSQLYPGAIIKFHDGKGRPYLSLVRRARVRLSPKTHRRILANPIPPVHIELVKPFLNYSLVFENPILKHYPYVVGFAEDRVIGGDTTHFFATLVSGRRHQSYSVYRIGEILRDPHTTQRLGYSAIHIADAKIVRPGEPATLVASHLNKPIRIGDHLMIKQRDFFSLDFSPHPPHIPINAHIIKIFDQMERAGNNQVVIISRGQADGVRPGDVLIASRQGPKVVDPVMRKRWIKLPDEHVAELMVFRTFSHVSFALSMKTWAPIHLYDHVVSPS